MPFRIHSQRFPTDVREPMAAWRIYLPIEATRATHTVMGVTLAASRLWTSLAFACSGNTRFMGRCLLDTGAPLCIVPFAFHHHYDFAFRPLAGVWPTSFTTWMGIPCILGSVSVWVPDQQPPFFRGPMTFIAKFAQATPPGIAFPLPIILGLNFLEDHQAETFFQCHSSPNAGNILLP